MVFCIGNLLFLWHDRDRAGVFLPFAGGCDDSASRTFAGYLSPRDSGDGRLAAFPCDGSGNSGKPKLCRSANGYLSFRFVEFSGGGSSSFYLDLGGSAVGAVEALVAIGTIGAHLEIIGLAFGQLGDGLFVSAALFDGDGFHVFLKTLVRGVTDLVTFYAGLTVPLKRDLSGLLALGIGDFLFFGNDRDRTGIGFPPGYSGDCGFSGLLAGDFSGRGYRGCGRIAALPGNRTGCA